MGLSKTRQGEVLEMLAHYLIGLAVLMKGLVKLDHFDHHPLSVIAILAAGAFILIGALLSRPLSRRLPNFPDLFHVAEGLALVLVGVILFGESSRIAGFLFFIGLIYLVIGGVQFAANPEQKKRLMPALAIGVGALFILGGLVAVVYNLMHDRNFWMFFTAGLMIVTGILLVLFLRRFPRSAH